MLKGSNSTTIDDIAQEAELSPATIYKYFRNKEELYASLNLITLQYLLNEVEKADKNSELHVEGNIKGFKDARYLTFKYEPLILRNIFHIHTGLGLVKEHQIRVLGHQLEQFRALDLTP